MARSRLALAEAPPDRVVSEPARVPANGKMVWRPRAPLPALARLEDLLAPPAPGGRQAARERT